MGESELRRRRSRPAAPSADHDPGTGTGTAEISTVRDSLVDDPAGPQPEPEPRPNPPVASPGPSIGSRPIAGPRPPRFPPGTPTGAGPNPSGPDSLASRRVAGWSQDVQASPARGPGPARPVAGGRPTRPVPGGSTGVGGPVPGAGVGARPTSGAGTGARFGEDREVERGLRGLVGSGSSQVSVDAALRARDAARPTEDDLAEAEERLAIIQRNWQPREDLPRR